MLYTHTHTVYSNYLAKYVMVWFAKPEIRTQPKKENDILFLVQTGFNSGKVRENPLMKMKCRRLEME